MRQKKNNYTDGIIYVYKKLKKQTDFAASINVKSLDDLEFLVKLCYGEKSKRQQDYEVAEKNDYELSKKIVTPLYDKVTNKQKVVEQGILYDIISIDYDKANHEMYLYLQEVGQIAE
ncbi:MAG: phage head closure protein [Anaerostipes sp.]|nr:phage head closure protein [Anaerostipes sp.]